MIINGKIGLKNSIIVKEYTKIGLGFENSSTLNTDVVAFVTGCGDYQDDLRKLLSEELRGNRTTSTPH